MKLTLKEAKAECKAIGYTLRRFPGTEQLEVYPFFLPWEAVPYASLADCVSTAWSHARLRECYPATIPELEMFDAIRAWGLG